MSAWAGRDGAGWSELLGLPVQCHDVVPSTNDRARERLREGARVPFVVVAEEQTRGRGRTGDRWSSPPGAGLWVSLGVPPAEPYVDRLLPLRVGLGLVRTLERSVSGQLLLKWPNDLYLAPPGGGKVGGVLCEVANGPDGRPAGVAVGVGINVTAVGPDAPEHAAALAPGGELTRDRLLPLVVEAVLAARAVSFPELTRHEQESWRARDLLNARSVVWIRPAGPPIPGRARGIDPRGRLVLDTETGPLMVESGSVRLPEQTNAGA